MSVLTRARARARMAAVTITLAGCGTERVPAPDTPAPSLSRPSDAIPGDLDVAVRIDLERARRTFGKDVLAALELAVAAPEDSGASRLVADAFERADTLWIALRPGLTPELTDNVLIVRGRFDSLRPRSYAGPSEWSPPVDLGADWRLFERPVVERRSAPVRLYMHSNRLMIFVSEAEIDSVERSVELRAGDEHVDPPDRGALSAALRVQPLLQFIEPRFGAVAELLAGATFAEGHVELDGAGMSGEIEVEFADEADVSPSREAAAELVERLARTSSMLGIIARGTQVDAVGKNLVLKLQIGPQALGKVILCFEAGKNCQ